VPIVRKKTSCLLIESVLSRVLYKDCVRLKIRLNESSVAAKRIAGLVLIRWTSMSHGCHWAKDSSTNISTLVSKLQSQHAAKLYYKNVSFSPLVNKHQHVIFNNVYVISIVEGPSLQGCQPPLSKSLYLTLQPSPGKIRPEWE